MPNNTLIAIAYLLSEAVSASVSLADIVNAAYQSGALPPEKVAELKLALKAEFAEAKEFWA